MRDDATESAREWLGMKAADFAYLAALVEKDLQWNPEPPIEGRRVLMIELQHIYTVASTIKTKRYTIKVRTSYDS